MEMVDPARLIRRAVFRAGTLVEFVRDWRRYTRYAFTGVRDARVSRRHLEAQLTLDYHRVEKGLTFKTPKQPFGASMKEHFDELIPAAMNEFEGHEFWLRSAVDADVALRRWNEEGEIDERVAPMQEARFSLADPERFFESRRSIRNFATEAVDDEVLNRAVAMAIKSPSVCNRQPWQVRFLRDDQIAAARVFQNGNRGIDPLPVLAVVTVDSRMFSGRGERHQGWIEGGIFATSLVYALHALGLDTCMLNMSVPNIVARRLRSELGIADHDLVVMMIAIGHGVESARAPRSARREVAGVRVE